MSNLYPHPTIQPYLNKNMTFRECVEHIVTVPTAIDVYLIINKQLNVIFSYIANPDGHIINEVLLMRDATGKNVILSQIPVTQTTLVCFLRYKASDFKIIIGHRSPEIDFETIGYAQDESGALGSVVHSLYTDRL